jgi:hypothetical protein
VAQQCVAAPRIESLEPAGQAQYRARYYPFTRGSRFVHYLNLSLASIEHIKCKGRLDSKLFLEQKVAVDLIPEEYHLITRTD